MKTNTFEKLSNQKQIQILDASAAVFAHKGYFQAGIAEICQAAEISNGALYKYFQNKKGLYLAVAQHTNTLLRKQGNAIPIENESIWIILRKIFEAAPPFLKKNKDYMIVYMDMGSPSMGEFAMELSTTFEKWSFDLFRKIAENAISRGEIKKSLSPDDVAYFLDNHLLLFAFSHLSEHYKCRFGQYLGKGTADLDNTQKINRIMNSLQQFLC